MTKRTFVSALTLIVVLAAAPAYAQLVQLSGRLNGGNEAPNKVLTGSVGTVECTVNVGLRTVSCTGDVFNLPVGVTAAHIHVGAEGVSGPVVCNATVPTGASNDFGFTISCDASTIVLRPDQGIRSIEDFVQAILGEGTYVNVHSGLFPGGEIRGQLKLN
jgi:hypothetical protein